MPTGCLAQQRRLRRSQHGWPRHTAMPPRSTHQNAVIVHFQGKTAVEVSSLGTPLHPRVAPCWHPRGNMLQVLSSPIVECCPALPPFVLTHSSPASCHCRHSHKALPQQPLLPEPKSQSQVRIQSPKNPVRGPEPEVQIQGSPTVQIPCRGQ